MDLYDKISIVMKNYTSEYDELKQHLNANSNKVLFIARNTKQALEAYNKLYPEIMNLHPDTSVNLKQLKIKAGGKVYLFRSITNMDTWLIGQRFKVIYLAEDIINARGRIVL